MSLLDTIKADQLTARKNREEIRTSLLTTLYAEAVNVGKNDGNRASTDAEVEKIIRKFVNNARDNEKFYQGNPEALTQVKAELIILEEYLPTMVADDVVQTAVRDIAATLEKSPRSIRPIMDQLKIRFGQNFDSARASKYIKDYLNA